MIITGPALVLLLASALGLLFLPFPVPRTATPAQRLYLTYCAECHGADGRGSWRAILLLQHPPNLASPRALAGLPETYLVGLVKNGGAPIGKPGMPAFGYHLSDDQVREIVAYVRKLAREPDHP